MAAYVISDVRAKDPDAFSAYRERAAASISSHGGRYLVRGGPIEPLEGEWSPETLVIVEFADLDSPRVVPLGRLRRGARPSGRRAVTLAAHRRRRLGRLTAARRSGSTRSCGLWIAGIFARRSVSANKSARRGREESPAFDTAGNAFLTLTKL